MTAHMDLKSKENLKFGGKTVSKYTVFAAVLFLIGVVVRVAAFTQVPSGLNQDEAFAGYEAFSLANYGKDSAGYAFPCYFVSWGSGMNVLESYLAIPFVKLMGCTAAAIRMPQLIMGIVSLPTLYLLLKKTANTKTALIGLGFLAVCPWHIMLSRWALESNLAPAFLLLGLYFFVLGLDNGKFLMLSALFYGLSLYAYAPCWAVVPLTLFAFALYLFISKRKLSLRYVLISLGILFVLALPLMLFVLVNNGIISEITLPFLSVPKLPVMRASEFSISNLFSPEQYYALFKLIFTQSDGLLWNCADGFGMYYMCSLPFALIGIVCLVTAAVKKVKARKFSYEILILAGALCSAVVCILIVNINVNRANSLHMYIIMFIVYGIAWICKEFARHKVIPRALTLCYALYFAFFCSYYFGSYKDEISYDFREGLQEAVEYAKNFDGTIYVDSSAYYPQIMYFDETPNDVYRSTVEYTNYPARFLNVSKFSRYEFFSSSNPSYTSGIYIVTAASANGYESNGFAVTVFENYAVAVK